MKLNANVLQTWHLQGYEKTLKLSRDMATSNMVAFDSNFRIKRYATDTLIMEEFYHLRLKKYGVRKEYLQSKLQRDV